MITPIMIFQALLGVIEAIPTINSWFNQFLAWYLTQQTNEILSQIADAASLAARSKTDADRFAAASAWQKALSNKRPL